MIRIIREHNTLNGLRFSVVEFGAMAVVVGGAAIYLAGSGAGVLAVLLLGVAANCVVVAAVGIRSLRAGEPDRGLAATFSPSARAQILQEHPQAQRATWVLGAVTLVPFAVVTAVAAGRIRPGA